MAINLNEKRTTEATEAAGKAKRSGTAKQSGASGNTAKAGKTAKAVKAAKGGKGASDRKPVCSVGKKRYYRVPVDSEMGRKLNEYLGMIMRMDLEASALGDKIGCYAYDPQENAERGGIGMVYFTQPASDDDPVWENIKEIPNEKGVLPAKLYACWPKVSATQRWAIDDERLAETKKTLVSDTIFTFASVVSTLKRPELAELAGVHIAPQAVVKGGKCVTPDGVEHLINTAGMSTDKVFKRIDELMKPWREKEDAEIRNRLMYKKFRAVLDFEGTDEAIDVLKQIIQLPCMDSGSLVSILAGSLQTGLHMVPLLVRDKAYMYVCCDIELSKDVFEPSSKAVFDAAADAFMEMLASMEGTDGKEADDDR